MSRAGDAAAVATKTRFTRLWGARKTCAHGHDLTAGGLYVRARGGYTTRECHECVKDQKRAAYRREISDPDKAARRREGNRAAVRAYRARRKESA